MHGTTRREFLRNTSHAALALGATAAIQSHAAVQAAAADSAAHRPDVVAVYYPHWHRYDHGIAWKGEGWTEWEGLKAAVSRFPGHHQPLKPTWGCFDESDPQCTAREIDLAADHGIDVFLYDWYWYSGVQNMQEALEQGFLRAANRQRMKFALMWANHDRRDQFGPEFGAPRTVWLPSRHSARDLRRVIDYCIEHYFRQPNYWRPAGGLFFSLFEATRFVKELGGPAETRKVFEEIDRTLAGAGLPPMHWNGMVAHPKFVADLQAAGFRSTSRYNVNSAGKAQDDGTESYEALMQAHRDHWQRMLSTPLVDMPVVTMGWDSTPRCRPSVPWPFPPSPRTGGREYPYGIVVVGNTPERFEQLLRDAARHAAGDPRQPFGVLLNAWNEWTEGGFLLPEERYGTGYVEAIRRAFGVRPGGA